MIAVLGAVDEEVNGLRRRMQIEQARVEQGALFWVGRYGNKRILLAQTGMGRSRAETSAAYALEHYPVTQVLACGFAGACVRGWRAGDLAIVQNLYDGSKVGGESLCSDQELFALAVGTAAENRFRFRPADSVSVNRVVWQPRAKKALGQLFLAQVAEMESYWLARAASAAQIPFLAVRAVSDVQEQALPRLERFAKPAGGWHWRQMGLYLLSRPDELVKLPSLVLSVRYAENRLSQFLEALIPRVSPN